MYHRTSPLIDLCMEKLTQTVEFKCGIMCRLDHLWPMQVHYCKIWNLFPTCQIHDINRAIIIGIRKQKNLKIRGLHVFVQSGFFQVYAAICFYIYTEFPQIPITPPGTIGCPVIGSICEYVAGWLCAKGCAYPPIGAAGCTYPPAGAGGCVYPPDCGLLAAGV